MQIIINLKHQYPELMENHLFIKNTANPRSLNQSTISGNRVNILQCGSNGALRLTGMFLELLEKQFPVRSPAEKMQCRFPVDFAEKLSVHVNHLNRSLKDITGKTTSQLIADRITQEAGVLLYGSKWNVCEIGYCFGFVEGPHFINFFKKNAKMSPTAYRRLIRSSFSDMSQQLSA